MAKPTQPARPPAQPPAKAAPAAPARPVQPAQAPPPDPIAASPAIAPAPAQPPQMTAAVLRGKLEASGTGKRKLAVIDKLLKEHAAASAGQAIDAMLADPVAVPEATIAKARAILGPP